MNDDEYNSATPSEVISEFMKVSNFIIQSRQRRRERLVQETASPDAIKKIEERLNILHPNTKLEEEWEELRALGEQYRKLEQHIKDKQATWDKLKAMPPPEID